MLDGSFWRYYAGVKLRVNARIAGNPAQSQPIPYTCTEEEVNPVAKVFVPTMLQPATGGVKEVEVEARNVRQVIERLDEMFPGVGERLVEDGDIRANLAVAVNGEVARMGLLERVGEDAEIHFVPAIGGG